MPQRDVTLDTIDQLPGDDLCQEIADYLAAFVQSGGLPSPLPGDDQALVWKERLRWWWRENPYRVDGQPLAYLLRNRENGDAIVGFHGFIPYDYQAAGEQVPSLIATTFFVDEAFRAHSMKIILKLNQLGRQYQILDGTPSPEMKAILDKFKFEKREEVHRFNLLVEHGGLRRAKALLLGKAGLAQPIGQPSGKSYRLIQDPAEIESIPQRTDDALRRDVSHAGLRWMTAIGNGERHFFGLVDDEGALQAYAIGLLKTTKGITACRMLEYGAFDTDDAALIDLMAHVAHHPDRCGLPKKVDLLLWSVFEGTLATLPDIEPEVRDASLYFKLPRGLGNAEKICLPCEGDLVLL